MSGAAEFGLQLSRSQADALARYAALLLRWNAVHNLTAIETPAHVLTHHLLDSLAIVPEVQSIAGDGLLRVLDVGAGGGLPGVALAIAVPNLHVTLVDKVQKKIAFLTQAKLELELGNVDCVHSRVETMQAESPFELDRGSRLCIAYAICRLDPPPASSAGMVVRDEGGTA